jgi:hypothetical protein
MSSADGIPAMIEATIGVGAGGLPEGTPSAAAGTLEDVTVAFTDALKAPQRSVVRSAVDDVVAFIVNSDAVTAATKPQLQALLRAVLSTLSAPAKAYHGGQIVRAYVATVCFRPFFTRTSCLTQILAALSRCSNAGDIAAVFVAGVERKRGRCSCDEELCL